MNNTQILYTNFLFLFIQFILIILSFYFLFLDWCISISNCLFLIYLISFIISISLIFIPAFLCRPESFKKYIMNGFTILRGIYIIMFVIMLIPESKGNCKNERVEILMIVFFIFEILNFLNNLFDSIEMLTNPEI